MRPLFLVATLAVWMSACRSHALHPGRQVSGDASLAPASGGASGSGGVTGTGGVTAPVDAAIAGDTMGSGGASETPRVLLINPPADQLRTCDADGQTVGDYRFALDFGPSYGRQTIWLAGKGIRWDFWPTVGGYPLNGRDPSASRILISASPSAGPLDAQLDAQVKVLTIDGKVEASYPIPQSHTQLALSPRGGYLYFASNIGASSSDPGYCQNCAVAILSSKDGSPVAQGIVTYSYLWSAVFSPDDLHFAYVTPKCAEGLHLLDLNHGQAASVVQAPLTCPSLARDTAFSVGLLTDGIIVSDRVALSDSGVSVALWFVDWTGKATPFAPAGALPSTSDALLAVHPDGRRALWSRSANGTVETFEFDRATLRSQPFAETHPECYGRTAATRYQVQGQSVLACPCGSETCKPFATLPTLQEPYTPELVLSPDRRFIAVYYGWTLGRLPQTEAPALFYDARGTLLLTLPNGLISFDRTSTLAMDCYSVGSVARDCALVTLATARVTTLSPARSFGFVYQ